MADGISETPWSDYKESDYSIEQWHRACLIHEHQGPPTSKDQCKLPVRTPVGVLSRAGVHAAAAALAGARGGVHASTDQLAAAHTALMRLYGKLNEQMPESMMKNMAHGILTSNEIRERMGLSPVTSASPATLVLTTDATKVVEDFLAHINKPGSKFDEAMVKRDKGGKFSTQASKDDAKDAEWLRQASIDVLAQQLTINNWGRIGGLVDRVVAKYNLPNQDALFKNPKAALEVLSGSADYLNEDSIFTVSPSGTRKLHFQPNAAGTDLDHKVIRVNARHVNDVQDPFGNPVRHDAMLRVHNFLAHIGRKGMRWGQHIFTSGSRSSSSGTNASSSSSGTEASSSSSSSKSSSSSSSTGIKSTTDLANLSDAQKAKAVAAKAKKSGVDSLSNQEMQVLVNRLNLETQYSKFKQQNSKINRGREFVNRQLKTGKTFNEMMTFANSPAGKLLLATVLPSKGKHADFGGSHVSKRA